MNSAVEATILMMCIALPLMFLVIGLFVVITGWLGRAFPVK